MNTPPPIHVTGNPALDWIIGVAAFLVALYWLRALRLAREGARRFLASAAKTVLIYFVALFVFGNLLKLDASRATGFSMCVALFAFVGFQKVKRSRYISAATKRAVIERDLPEGGYDPQLHHIDHVWPHSKGGSNTSDNLRVTTKQKNLQKGAKRPPMREMW